MYDKSRMPTLLGRLYRRRIINVNVNVLLANALAIASTAAVVHYARFVGLEGASKWGIVVFTFLVDLVVDVGLYYVLHWLANHWPRKLHGRVGEGTRHLLEESPPPSFFKDATIVQAQRFTLSPLFYILAMGMQKWALHQGVDKALSVVVAYGIACIVTRTIHTYWMLKAEKVAKMKRLKALREERKAEREAASAAA